jgi:hypothetical protein
MIEHLKIILFCVAAAIAYGIQHAQITARVCVEYFTVFHPHVFATQSPARLITVITISSMMSPRGRRAT